MNINNYILYHLFLFHMFGVWSLKHIEFPVLMAHFCIVSKLLVPTYFPGFMTIEPFRLEDHP